jgi:GTP cyclohydrolase I
MEELGWILPDDSFDEPYRVAKCMSPNYRLDPKKQVKISVFDNKYEYSKMLVEKRRHHL